ncbi:ferric reductase-like transmembrane domain-containing protein [Streptomyces sp. NPDC051907]|uniref:ferric reductase-like transmembrane domain-containing protein n=1 Tax=Streptomyces sp. NPDC051907 TaxID=3155284 RepID=UPI0034390C63
MIAVAGSDSFRAALDFTTGVLSLVSLTASIAWGLLATDRLLLSPRHRLLAQGIHRSTAVASLGFLLLHATVKVSLGHVELLGALIPFGLGVTGTSGLIGFGSLAGFLMVVAATTGALRSALAGNIRIAGRWRALHMLAYPAWCSALVHGLYTGRPAAAWVTTMYCLALTGVAAAVSVRLAPRPLQRRIANKILSLTGGSDGTPAEQERQRDLSTSPLPGASGLTGPADLNGRAGRRRMNGIPAQRPYEAEFERESPLGSQSRAQPRRLEAPSPQLYEAPPPPVSEPIVSGDPSGALSGSAGARPGFAAAYRAVSLGGDQSAPLAERVPMTEEIPVVSESGPRAGLWPTPSPPPPAQAPPAPAAPPSYDTPPPPLFETPPTYEAPSYEATSPYETPASYGATSSYDFTASFDAPASYDATASYDPPSSYDATASYDSSPAYTPMGDPSTSYDPAPPYDTGNIGSFDETATMPGPLFPPPAGEPWHAPAGERP